LIAGGHATAQDLVRIVGRLARFYRDGVPVAMTGEAFRRGFEQGIADHLRELGRPAFDLPPDLIATSAMQQRGLLERRPDLFDQRVADGRVLEAHGDLRPEHICVDGEPQIIDCLEFSYPLRVLDAADELAFLALECERLGAPAFAATIFGTYAEVTGDTPPPALLAFYQSYRASVRAMLAIRHLDDAAPREPSRWAPQARAYLELACRHGARIA
jgi:aminoglycoside phosphotransferase family enzyme